MLYSDHFSKAESNIKTIWKVTYHQLQRKQAQQFPSAFNDIFLFFCFVYGSVLYVCILPVCSYASLYTQWFLSVKAHPLVADTKDSFCKFDLPDRKDMKDILLDLNISAPSQDEICA